MSDLIKYKASNSAITGLNKFFSKLLPKQKNSMTSLNISTKRKNLIKKYNLLSKSKRNTNKSRKIDKFNEEYNLYIEALNDYIL